MRNLHPPYNLTLFPQKLIIRDFLESLSMLRNNIKMKQNFLILSAIFGRKLLKLDCYTMENFVIPKTGMLHQ